MPTAIPPPISTMPAAAPSATCQRLRWRCRVTRRRISSVTVASAGSSAGPTGSMPRNSAAMGDSSASSAAQDGHPAR